MLFIHNAPISAERLGVMHSLEFRALLPFIFLTALLSTSARGQTAAPPSRGGAVADAIKRVQENDLGTGLLMPYPS
jgi:hypothetical protein